MGVLEAVSAFFKALPDIMKLINRVMDQWTEAKRQGVLNDINAALDKSETAKTPQERTRAMLDLVRAVSRPR
jgi:hypothetical protein